MPDIQGINISAMARNALENWIRHHTKRRKKKNNTIIIHTHIDTIDTEHSIALQEHYPPPK